MNYLTNYYKNLSEKLQTQVNLLENRAQQLNEAIATTTVYGNRPNVGDSQYSGSYMYGDYNGDGVVDGADLGIALGGYGQPGYDYQNVIQNWTGNMQAAGPAFRSTRINRGQGVRGASDMGVGSAPQFGVAGSAGGYGGAARASVGGRPTMSDVGYGGQAMGAAGPAGGYGGQARGSGRGSSPTSGGGMGGAQGSLPGDYNGDGRVDGADISYVLNNWGQFGQQDLNNVNSNFGGRFGTPTQFRSTSSRRVNSRDMESAGGYGGQAGGGLYDLNGDGRVDGADLGLMLGNYDQYGNAGISNLIANWSGVDTGVGVPSYRAAGGSRPLPRPEPGKGTNVSPFRRPRPR